MSNLITQFRQLLADVFERLARANYRYAKTTVGCLVLFTVACCSGLLELYIDVSPETMLGKSNPKRIAYNDFRRQFGSDENIIIIVQSGDIFSEKFLLRLKQFHNDLSVSLPFVGRVDSLINARITHSDGDELVIEDLSSHWPTSQKAFEQFKLRIINTPSYLNLLFDRSQTITTVSIKPLPSISSTSSTSYNLLKADETAQMMQALNDIMPRYQGDDFDLALIGGPPTAWTISRSMETDMGLFTGLVILIISVMLYLLFKRVSGVVLPIVVVALSLMSTFGIMGLLGLPLAAITQVMPSFLLAVGISDAVHFLVIFYQQIEKGESKEDSVAYAASHASSPILLTSLTTAGGLCSFYFMDLKPIADFGLVAPMGVILALIYTVLLLPALIRLLPIKEGVGFNAVSLPNINRTLSRCGRFSAQNPIKVVGLWIIVASVGIYSASQLRFVHNVPEMLDSSTALRKGVDLANDKLGWGAYLDIVIDTHEAQGIYEPSALEFVSSVQGLVNKVSTEEVSAANTSSLADLVREVNRGLNQNDESFYKVPINRELIAQELLLFELSGHHSLPSLVDSTYQTTRINVLLPEGDVLLFQQYIERLEDEINQIKPASYSVEISGVATVVMEAFRGIMEAQAKSYLMALLIITPLMILVVGEIRLGILSMLPNIIPILAAMQLMAICDIPMNIFTIMLGSIVIGISVDDTIHFLFSMKRYQSEGVDTVTAIEKTLASTGTALSVTSICLISGFLVFSFASMDVVQAFGFIVAFAIFIAFLADIMLVPALVVLSERLK